MFFKEEQLKGIIARPDENQLLKTHFSSHQFIFHYNQFENHFNLHQPT